LWKNTYVDRRKVCFKGLVEKSEARRAVDMDPDSEEIAAIGNCCNRKLLQ
jgi:hypothetical protein